MARFNEEFWPFLDEMAERCFFVEAADGRVVGTTTAWRGEMCGERQGRIHWVAVAATHQGQGLAKVLMAAALEYMAANHERCYLTTQTTSARAIRLYLQLGFRPLISAESLDRAVSPDNSVAEGEERTVEKEAEAWDSIKHLLPAIL